MLHGGTYYVLYLQIGFSTESCIMSSCVKPMIQRQTSPVVLLHCFDRFAIYASHTKYNDHNTHTHTYIVFAVCLWLQRQSYFMLNLIDHVVFASSCLEWRCTYPLLEEAGLEVWAVDVLGWGFSDLG